MRLAAWLGCLLIALTVAAGCGSGGASKKKKKDIDWRVRTDVESKKAYDLSIFSNTYKYYFPAAKVEQVNKNFRLTSLDARTKGYTDSPALLTMTGLEFNVSRAEWKSALKFMRAGNEIVIFAAGFDPIMQRSLHFYKPPSDEHIPLMAGSPDSARSRQALRLEADTGKYYGYYGRDINSYFRIAAAQSEKTDTSAGEEKSSDSYSSSSSSGEEDDSYSNSYDDDDDDLHGVDTIPTVLGRSKLGPDFIRYRIGLGHLTLHCAPLAISNYFLLQPGNRAYLDGIWHTLPNNIGTVYTDNYQYKASGESSPSSLIKYPSILRAFWILLGLLLIYVLFSLKPLQRMIPVIRPLQNESVSFVETIGRLYYNRSSHNNLAEKMIQHFLEWVRSNYYLDTSKLNDAFAESLAAKSGRTRIEVGELLRMIHAIRGGVAIDGPYLQRLYSTIQSYYKS